MFRVERFLRRIERTGSDVAVNDPQRQQRKRRSRLWTVPWVGGRVGRGKQLGGSGHTAAA